MNYAYQGSFQSIWNDFDHLRFRDHNFSYPTANAAIGTIAWEGFREAVDDYKYIVTLERGIASAAEEDYDSVSEAEKYLKNLKSSGFTDLYLMRENIAEHITKIKGGCQN